MQRAALLLGRKADLSLCDMFLQREHAAHIHTLEWERLDLDALGGRPERLIVAIGAPEEPASVSFFERLAQHRIAQTVLALVDGEQRELVAAAAAHADDFAFWPPDSRELEQRLGRLLRVSEPSREGIGEKLARELALAQLVGGDPQFVSAVRQIPLFARSGMQVLIVGETGTGKELCARAL